MKNSYKTLSKAFITNLMYGWPWTRGEWKFYFFIFFPGFPHKNGNKRNVSSIMTGKGINYWFNGNHVLLSALRSCNESVYLAKGCNFSSLTAVQTLVLTAFFLNVYFKQISLIWCSQSMTANNYNTDELSFKSNDSRKISFGLCSSGIHTLHLVCKITETKYLHA